MNTDVVLVLYSPCKYTEEHSIVIGRGGNRVGGEKGPGIGGGGNRGKWENKGSRIGGGEIKRGMGEIRGLAVVKGK